MSEITLTEQIEAVDNAVFDTIEKTKRGKRVVDALIAAVATLRHVQKGEFFTTGEFIVPPPTWDDISKPCPRCGVYFTFIAGGSSGYAGGKET